MLPVNNKKEILTLILRGEGYSRVILLKFSRIWRSNSRNYWISQEYSFHKVHKNLA